MEPRELSHALEIVLPQGRSVHGHVRDRDGRPIDGAWVAWLPFSAIGCFGPGRFPFDTPRLGRSGADGSYQLDDLPERCMLVATGPEHAADYDEETASGDHDFALAHVGTLTGEVTDAITGTPLAGVRVADAVATGADGRFVASANGWSFSEHAIAEMSFAKEGYAGIRRSIERPQPGEIVRVRLHPTARLTGRLVDPGGAPIASASLSVQSAGNDGSTEGWSELLFGPPKTAHDGSYQLELAAGIAWTIHVQAPGMPELACGTITAQPGEHLERTLVAGGGRELRGIVRASESGEPIAGAGVMAVVIRENGGRFVREDRCRASTDASGRFVLRGLSDDQVWLTAGIKGRARHAESVSLAADREIDVRLEPALAIEGDVVDPEGKPLARVGVRLKPELPEPLLTAIGWEQRETDEHGHVRFDFLGGGVHVLGILPSWTATDGALTETIVVEPPVTQGRWVLHTR